MRREFLFTNEVTIDEYMAKAAKLLRSMRFGEKLDDGSCLAEDLPEEEQAELANYIYEIAYQEMIKSAGKHCLRKCDFGEYADDFINNFAVVIMKRLHLSIILLRIRLMRWKAIAKLSRRILIMTVYF